jgi:AraC-like DNA-binding protein
MNAETLEVIAKSNVSLKRTSVVMFKGANPLKHIFNPDMPVDLVSIVAPSLLQLTAHANCVLLGNSIVFGIVFDKESDLSLIFGPFKLKEVLNDEDVKQFSFGVTFDQNYLNGLKEFLDLLPIINHDDFINIAFGLNAQINHEITPLDFTTSIPTLGTIYSDKIYNKEVEAMDQGDNPFYPNNSFEEESQMMDAIRTGNLQNLYKAVMINNVRKTDFSPDQLRDYKDRSLYFITLATHAAIEGGLDANTAFLLNTLYFQRVEASANIVQVKEAVHAALDDYCKKVINIRGNQTSNPTINRVINYIHEHMHEKITAKEIAASLNLAPGYISTRFKKQTGTKLPDYINGMKIQEAKRMLVYTDKSLSDIANHLSFSSQSYFQNVFKKVVGMTPKDYREKNQLRSEQ